MSGGLPVVFGACMAASTVEMLVSRVLKYTRRIITPLVSGIVVTLIGMSLIKVGITACGGGEAAKADGSFGSLRHVGLAALVLVLIIAFNRSANRYLRMSSIVIGLAIGYAVAWYMGIVDFSSVQSYGGFNIPVPFKYGLSFDWSAFVALGLVYLITAIEAHGDITANSLISGEPVEGKTFVKRASGGILADGFNSMLAGAFSSFPNSIFAQNNGMIQLTGVASRYVGYYIAGFLVLLGLFPAVGLVFSLMPEPVLGGATLLMFGTVASAGIRIIASQEIDRKATLVMALSFSPGPQRGTRAGNFVAVARHAEKHLRVGHHHGRRHSHIGQRPYPHQRIKERKRNNPAWKKTRMTAQARNSGPWKPWYASIAAIKKGTKICAPRAGRCWNMRTDGWRTAPSGKPSLRAAFVPCIAIIPTCRHAYEP